MSFEMMLAAGAIWMGYGALAWWFVYRNITMRSGIDALMIGPAMLLGPIAMAMTAHIWTRDH